MKDRARQTAEPPWHERGVAALRPRHDARTLVGLAVAGLAAALGGTADAAVVSGPGSGAAYTLSARSYLYAGQQVPGTGEKAERTGWFATPTADPECTLLTDGRLDWEHSARTHFWSQQDKVVEVIFDLGQPRALESLDVVLSSAVQAGNGIDRVTLHWGAAAHLDEAWAGALRFSRPASEGWEGALCFAPDAAAPPGAVLRSPRIGERARFIRIVCESRQPIMALGEVIIHEDDADHAATASPADRVAPLRFKPAPPMPPVAVGRLSAAYDWIARERIRGIYGYVDDRQKPELLDQIEAASFNLMLVHVAGPVAMSAKGWAEETAAWGKVQKERGLRILVSWPYGSDERYGNTQFGAYHDGSAKLWTKTPCPLSREYWDKVIGDRAVAAAEAGLAGLVVDPEMYGADSTSYPGPCYCERCWQGYVAAHVEGLDAGTVPLAERAAWTERQVVSQDYQRWQEATVVEILRGVRGRVRAVRPDFLLGNLTAIEYLPGLARGLGTPEMPALIFGEREYKGRDEGGWFNVSGLPERVANLAKDGYPALFVSGLWIQPVVPPDFPRLAVTLGAPYAGYWVWSTAGFGPDAHGDYAHHPAYTDEDYWAAFKTTHTALTAALKPSLRWGDVWKAIRPRPGRRSHDGTARGD
jgi:hypothetical protein